MVRRIREEIIDDDPVVVRPAPLTRRVVTERRVGGPAMGMNPLAMVVAALLLVFLLVLVFGHLV
jgi:hypothetical protein